MDPETHEAMTTMAEFAALKAPREIMALMLYLDTFRFGPLALALQQEKRAATNNEKVQVMKTAFDTADLMIAWSKKNPPTIT